MKLKNGLWADARKQRPRIYQRPRPGLFHKHLARDPQFSQYRKYFREYVQKTRIPEKPTLLQLHSLVAKCMGGRHGASLASDILHEEGASLRFAALLPTSILVRDILLRRGLGAEKATELALDAIEGHSGAAFAKLGQAFHYNVIIGGTLRRGDGRSEAIISDLGRQVAHAAMDRSLKFTEIWEELENVFVRRPFEELDGISNRSFELRKHGDAVPDRMQLGRMSHFVSSEHSSRRMFSYPMGAKRLQGIFGEEFVSKPWADDIGELGEQVQRGRKGFAAILMFPWEADHITKAKEMLKRGLEVARPAAKVIKCGIEFGIFEWVRGNVLSHIEDAKVWEAYGKTLRAAHEVGIVLDDAAGRNAIWDGKKITLIDFEHTWFVRERGPVSDELRSPGLRRVLMELSSKKNVSLLSAFEQGYGKHEALWEARDMLNGDYFTWED